MERLLVRQIVNGANRSRVFGTAVASTRFLRTSAPQRSEAPTSSESAPMWSLKGKRVFVAGVADDQGYGWAVAYALANAGAELVFGVWPPVLNIFNMAWKNGKFNKSRKLANGKMLEIAKVYTLDAAYDTIDEVPPEVRKEKRYAALKAYTIADVAALVKKDFGKVDLLVHSLANGPEVKKQLHETSRAGYLSAISTSAYSNVSMLRNFAPLMPQGGASLSLTYIASERVIPGYGGGMSTAKAALESDTRVLAWELGRKYGIRVNTISAGGLRSRAARAIGFIDAMVSYSKVNAPLTKDLSPSEVGQAALFLLSPAGSAVTGHTLYVDNGLHAMGLAVDSPQVSHLFAEEAAKKGLK